MCFGRSELRCKILRRLSHNPSSEIIEVLSAALPDAGGTFIQMEDELASMGAIIGASVMGVKSITATSGPGFDLMQENLAFAAMAEIPCVVVDVQRSGPSTGGATNPSQGDLMQVKYGRSADTSVIALYPNSVKEIYQMTIEAFNFSETYMTPVILLMDEIIGHLRESICIGDYSDMKLAARNCPPVIRRSTTLCSGRDGNCEADAFCKQRGLSLRHQRHAPYGGRNAQCEPREYQENHFPD